MKALTAVLVLLLTATGLTAQSAPPELRTGPVLRPGDVLRITVLRHPELSGEFVVTTEGTLVHPVYRELTVAGMPLSEADELVRAVLSRYEARPEFVLDPLFQVAVSGEVRQPSLYALRPATTIAQAVALAGGATERGRIDRVRLFRSGDEHVIDLSRPELGMGMEPVQSGDQIVIERRTSLFRDYIAPAGSVVAALAAVLNIMIR
ncbi:MAG TPA: polysaccharide biosynthesis/export family protein [Longimicrobiales bacterium]